MSHDTGLLHSKYFDYESDDAAREAEDKLAAGLDGTLFEDEEFPCEGTSLYKNPHAPPRGILQIFGSPAPIQYNVKH
jgi:hypothetical protein